MRPRWWAIGVIRAAKEVERLGPKGLNALIQPVGQGQVDAIDEAFTRAEARGLLANATLSPIFTSLRAKRNELQAAVDRRKAAYATLAGAMTAEMIAREDFCTGYSKEIGLIRSIYPNDRTMQEFFFDTFRKSGGSVEDDGEEAPPTGGGEPAPA
jgi:hypothetical protein